MVHLDEIFPTRIHAQILKVAQNWRAGGLGRYIESNDDGWSGIFSFNESAVDFVDRLKRQSVIGRLRSISLTDRIAIFALVAAIIAIFK